MGDLASTSQHETQQIKIFKEKRSIGVQTLFRESEAQTDPAALGQIERDGTFLEILELCNFSYGKGLPVSMYEIDLISKMREKRSFNDALPPLSDEACFFLRRRITQEQEVREWSQTEKEYKEANNQRLLKLQQLLETKEKHSEEVRMNKIDELKGKKDEEVESFIIKTRKIRVKIIRSTEKQKENFNRKDKFKRDIILEYASFGSKVYAPLTRDGSNPDRNNFKFEMHSDYLVNFEGLNELERKISNKYLNTKVSINQIEDNYDKYKLKKQDKMHLKAIEEAFNSIQKTEENKILKEKLELERIAEENKGKVEKTKVVEKKTDEVNYVEEIMLIQRLLKGRKEQNLMYEGKFKRAELIKELRAADLWKSAGVTEEENQMVDNYVDKLTNGVVDAIQGRQISQSLDYLSKEMIRIKEENKINAIINRAEEERRKREAEELGRRQAEVLIRNRQDILYKELLDTNQATMDSYINSLLSGNVNKVSKKQVMREIEIKAKKLNTIVDKIESEFIKDDVTVRDLVSSFIIPEIDRTKVENKLQLEERRFLETSKMSIHTSLKTAKNKLSAIKEKEETEDKMN